MPRFACTCTYTTPGRALASMAIQRTADNAQMAVRAARAELTRRTRRRARNIIIDVREDGAAPIVACARDTVNVLFRLDGSGGEPWAVVASHDRLALIYRAIEMLEAHKGAHVSTPIDLLRTDGARVAAASGPVEFYIAPLEMIHSEGKTIA